MTRFLRIVAAGIAALWMTTSSMAAQHFGFFGQSQQPEPVVKGAPYSGEGVTTVKLTMYDGTKIERTVISTIYRDSAGRVRRSQNVVGLEALDEAKDFRVVVTILDPVADVIYTLNPGSRTAERLPLAALRNQKVPALAQKWQTREESLGNKDIDGFAAVGTRVTTTIPAGQVGNDRPIEIIDERWESPALKVVLRSLHRDPRSGDIGYTLTKISRTEPAASMFEVPAGYKVEDSFLIK